MSRVRTGLLLLALMLFGLAGWALRPEITPTPPGPTLAEQMPQRIGPWEQQPNALDQIAATATNLSMEQPYDEIVTRTYRNPGGEIMMLTLAFGRNQRQEIKIHRPELCYPSQGFKVKQLQNASFEGVRSQASGETISGKRMVAAGNSFDEIVSYWIRIGGTYSESAWQTRWTIFREGMNGRMTDGILVRVSQRVNPGVDPEHSYRVQQEFLQQLVASLQPSAQSLLVR
jgi:EpsI family protein